MDTARIEMWDLGVLLQHQMEKVSRSVLKRSINKLLKKQIYGSLKIPKTRDLKLKELKDSQVYYSATQPSTIGIESLAKKNY